LPNRPDGPVWAVEEHLRQAPPFLVYIHVRVFCVYLRFAAPSRGQGRIRLRGGGRHCLARRRARRPVVVEAVPLRAPAGSMRLVIENSAYM
jgi:hypothetical protein